MLSAVSSSEEYDVGSDVDSSEDELKREDFVPPAFEIKDEKRSLSYLAKEENSIPSSKEYFVPPDFEIKDEKDFYRE